jgi:hypothetical protein
MVVLESCGTTVDSGLTPEGPAVGAGVVSITVVSAMLGTEVVVPAEQLVQMTEVEVRTTVETVVVGTRIVDPPLVIVFVTGQVVMVV